ncbi:YchJ family protein [Ferrovibrio xuzhouensis]|uniref:YchJ family protein n=1 Tax=Ferrovibrio xuzhouensis TaxID=1576914 RepID=A0ABV7VDG5_9PROT
MSQCPCHSGLGFEACCGPYLDGRPVPTALALMRSRYTAYTRGDAAYLGRTITQETKAEFDPAEAKSVGMAARWLGLDIIAVSGGGVDDQQGVVEYAAKFRLHGEQRVHHERATFRREDGVWLCSGGEVAPKSAPRRAAKVGRNDVCPCGSGRKYKKCCGANP